MRPSRKRSAAAVAPEPAAAQAPEGFGAEAVAQLDANIKAYRLSQSLTLLHTPAPLAAAGPGGTQMQLVGGVGVGIVLRHGWPELEGVVSSS